MSDNPLAALKVGDKVCVRSAAASRTTDEPPDGYAGTVVKVARKYLTVHYHNSLHGKEERFKIENGRSAEADWRRFIRTPEQEALASRKHAVEDTLNEYGFTRRFGYKHSLEMLEAVAATLRQFPPNRES